MADFPSAIYAPRTIENRPGVVYDANDTKTFFAEDHEQVTGEIVAVENALGANLVNIGLNGWLPLATIPTLQASDDPVYTLRFGADMTAILGIGQKIKLTQHGSVKYFIIVKIGAYTGGNTDVDVYGGTDYDMENTGTYPVTLPNYSLVRCPFGFPMSPTKWTVRTVDTSQRSQASPAQNTWYNLGSVSLVVPIGAWDIYHCVNLVSVDNSSSTSYNEVSLSTSNNSVSDSERTCGHYSAATGATANSFITNLFRRKFALLASKTTFYLISRTTGSGLTEIRNDGNFSPTIIEAVCAYL